MHTLNSFMTHPNAQFDGESPVITSFLNTRFSFGTTLQAKASGHATTSWPIKAGAGVDVLE